MSPEKRPPQTLLNKNSVELRKSAVAILLFPKQDQIQSVLIQRTIYKGAHSGQISFPGGKHEESDHNLSFTAQRELQEELGVESNKIEELGKLSSLVIPVSNFQVQPYIYLSEKQANFIPEKNEVAEIIEFPLEVLFRKNITAQSYQNTSSGFRIKVPYFNIRKKIVWGATAMILSEFRELLKRNNELIKVIQRT